MPGWAEVSQLPAGLLAAVAFVIVVACAACAVTPLTFGRLSRDPLAISEAPFYVGCLSNLGVLLWCAAATACFFAAAVLRPASGAREVGLTRGFFLCSGALTAVLTCDDLFMLHERFFPLVMGVPEKLVLASYAVAGCAYLARFHKQLLRTRALPLAAAFGCFAVSVACDVFIPDRLNLHAAEDGAKLLGIAAWCGYFLDTSLAQVRTAVVGSRLSDLAAGLAVRQSDAEEIAALLAAATAQTKALDASAKPASTSMQSGR